MQVISFKAALSETAAPLHSHVAKIEFRISPTIFFCLYLFELSEAIVGGNITEMLGQKIHITAAFFCEDVP